MDRNSRPGSAASRGSMASHSPSPSTSGQLKSTGSQSHKGKAQKKQRLQEEYAAVPSCPMLYALVQSHLQPTQDQLLMQTQRTQGAKLEHNASLTRADSGSGNPKQESASPRSLSPAPDPPQIRVRSWDVSDLSRQMLSEAGQPWLCRLPFSSLSLAAECLVNAAMVTLDATWTVDDVALPASEDGTLDCLFVLPLNEHSTVCGVEVIPGPKRMLATAVIASDEARDAAENIEALRRQQEEERDVALAAGASTGTVQPMRAFNRAATSPLPNDLPQTAQSAGQGKAKLRVLANKRLFSKNSAESGVLPDNPRDGRMPPIASSRSSDDTGVGANGIGWGQADTEKERASGGLSGDEDENVAKASLASSPLLSRRVDAQTAATLLLEPEGFCPCLFRLRVPKVRPGSSVQVRVTYLETMQLQPGTFNEITVPLTVPWDCLPGDTPLHEVVRVSCMINSGIHQPMKIGDFNHPMKVLFVELGRATFVGYPDPEDPDSWPNAHFTASYQVASEESHAGALVQAPVVSAQDPRATVCMTLCLPETPPAEKPVFPRAVVFVIDSSASLRSRQMDDSRRAIAAALKRLDPRDSFLLIAFDYELLTSADGLEPATPDNVKRACKFVLRAHDCDSPCNIFTPLDLALQVLQRQCPDSSEDEREASRPTAVLPQIVLITDTSVPDERRICNHIQTCLLEWGRNPPRIFTFGIGQGCNFYFLKWLSSVSRGTTTMTYNIEEVRGCLDKLLLSISKPMVTNVTVKELPAGCELYPYPMPDLYLAVPVVVTGKMGSLDEDGEGEPELGLPSHLHLRGLYADGTVWRSKAQLMEAGNVPLNSVGIKEQLEILSADAWLHEDQALDELVSSLSMSASVPSENTNMVFFETSSALFSDFQRDRVQGTRADIRSYLDPKALSLVRVPGLSRGFGRSSISSDPKRGDEGQGEGISEQNREASAAAIPVDHQGLNLESYGNEQAEMEGLGGAFEERLQFKNVKPYPEVKRKGLFNLRCAFPRYGDIAQ